MAASSVARRQFYESHDDIENARVIFSKASSGRAPASHQERLEKPDGKGAMAASSGMLVMTHDSVCANKRIRHNI